MKNTLCAALLLLVGVPCYAGPVLLKNNILPRSQSRNSARLLSAWHAGNEFGREDAPGQLQITFEYGQSWNARKIAQSVFGDDSLVFAGSRAYNTTDMVRNGNAILADYFSLPANFLSVVSFRPRISTALVDLQAEYRFDAWCSGLFARVQAPIVYSSWNLRFDEKVIFGGDGFHPAGYMSNARINRAAMPDTVKQAWSCPVAIGDMQEALQYGKLAFQCDKIGVADVRAELGYELIDKECSYVSVSVQGAAPTGTRIKPDYMFVPVIGNGRHWELGAGLCAEYTVSRNAEDDSRSYVHLDLSVAHLFASRRQVSFDFTANGAGSRYMLLAEMGTPVVGLLVGANPAPLQYQKKLVPAINRTTLCAKTRVNWQVDAAIAYVRECGNRTVSVGYNLWARDRERVVCRDAFKPTNLAIKGDAQLYGFEDPQNTALVVSQSQATVLGGQGVGNFRVNDFFENKNVDNAVEAGGPLFQVLAADAGAALADVNTLRLSQGQANVFISNPAVLLTDADINNKSGVSARALSHKFFAQATYEGTSWCNCATFWSVGGEFEWNGSCAYNNDAVGGWGLWLKGGIAY